jgi:hypothetical protein
MPRYPAFKGLILLGISFLVSVFGMLVKDVPWYAALFFVLGMFLFGCEIVAAGYFIYAMIPRFVLERIFGRTEKRISS